jgi:hypothetical protein
VIIPREFVAEILLFPVLKQGFGNFRFKEDREVNHLRQDSWKYGTRTDIIREKKSSSNNNKNALDVAGTVLESGGILALLIMDCF